MLNFFQCSGGWSERRKWNWISKQIWVFLKVVYWCRRRQIVNLRERIQSEIQFPTMYTNSRQGNWFKQKQQPNNYVLLKPSPDFFNYRSNRAFHYVFLFKKNASLTHLPDKLNMWRQLKRFTPSPFTLSLLLIAAPL